MHRFAALAAVILIGLAAASPARAELHWSNAHPVDREGANALTALTCPSSAMCVGGDVDGRLLDFEPAAAPHAHLRTVATGAIAGVSCLTPSLCVAVGGQQAITFDPTQPTGQIARTVEDPSLHITAVACPKSSLATALCAGVDDLGRTLEIIPGADHAPPVPLGASTPFTAVDCAAYPRCVAVNQAGEAVSFPANATGPVFRAPVDPGHRLTAVSCTDATRCTAADDAGRVMSFAWGATAAGAVTTIDAGHALTGVSCHSRCWAVDDAGRAFSFDPTAPGAPAAQTIDAATALTAVACRSNTACNAIDARGHEVVFGGSAAPARHLVDAAVPLAGVACVSTTSCFSVDRGGRLISFDPGDTDAAQVKTIDAGHKLTAVTCRTTRCVAVDGAGRSLSFDPANVGTPAAASIDAGHALVSVACQSGSRCTAVDDAARYLIFTPTAPGTPAPVALSGVTDPRALDCPATTQCTVVDGTGHAKTFDPEASAAAPQRAAANVGSSLVAVSCVSTSRCFAVGGDTATGFDPLHPNAFFALNNDEDAPFVALTCRNETLCVTADALGGLAEGEPGQLVRTQLSNPGTISGLDCPSRYVCVAVSRDGNAFRGRVPVPAADTKPTITGTPTLFKSLTRFRGTWRNAPTSYKTQWLRCGSNGGHCIEIAGATHASYKLGGPDITYTIRVKVTATNPTGPGTSRSLPTAKVET